MSQDWYQRHIGPRGRPPAPAAEPTRFVIGPDGRAYPMAQEGALPPMAPVVQQYPQAGVQPWNRPPMLGDAPIGATKVTEALQYWRGSRDANAAQSGRCPGCGSPNFFPALVAQTEGGGESGKLSAGQCLSCGWINTSGRSDGFQGPSIQHSFHGVRAMGAGGDAIPVEQARSVAAGNTDWDGRPGGGFAVFQKVG